MGRLNGLYLVMAAGCLILSGCGTLRSEAAFDRVTAGMSRHDVAKRLGNPAIVRGCLVNERCEKVEVWEYKVGCPKKFERVVSELSLTALSFGAAGPILLSSADTDRYWVYFANGGFAGWGPAGDWDLDAEKIRAMKFGKERT